MLKPLFYFFWTQLQSRFIPRRRVRLFCKLRRFQLLKESQTCTCSFDPAFVCFRWNETCFLWQRARKTGCKLGLHTLLLSHFFCVPGLCQKTKRWIKVSGNQSCMRRFTTLAQGRSEVPVATCTPEKTTNTLLNTPLCNYVSLNVKRKWWRVFFCLSFLTSHWFFFLTPTAPPIES